MPNNPVQIVLNAQDYVHRAEVNPGGSIKDFYKGRNAAFAHHRDEIAHQLTEIQTGLRRAQRDDVFYAKVELQAEAWAKSHRPTQKIFQPKALPYVGSAELGSMVIEFTPSDIPAIVASVQAAEEVVPETEDRQGNRKPKPSRLRSEVGAIKSIRPYSTADRRHFSLEQANRWLSDPRTGGAYYVETFISADSIQLRFSDELKLRGERVLKKFEADLAALKLPIEVTKVSDDWIKASIFVVKLKEEVLKDRQASLGVHENLLAFLDNQQVVKSILLPPVLQTADVEGEPGPAAVITSPEANRDYPTIGIIDSGVSTFDPLVQWRVGTSDYLNLAGQDVEHGTFIAGLVCGGDELNVHAMFREAKCKFFDLGLFPTVEGEYSNYYPRGFIDFLEQLDAEIPLAKEQGVRIFNMSLAVTTPVADDGYSIFANILDQIADKHDIIFVLPAGNLGATQARDDWPDDPNAAMAMLAIYRFAGQDRIYQPADSIRALVIGALDPEREDGTYQPSRYTRRGPGPALGAKPDLAHVGGRLRNDSGLRSLTPDGRSIESCGTSFAAPLAAKTMATLDHAIEGAIPRETLMALAIHHAVIPPGLDSPLLRPIARDFVGAGIPRLATETLVADDNEITMIFNGVLQTGQELKFQFTWPASLVDATGKCSGKVSLTLVYLPPVDRSHGGEFVRVNLDAYLRQEVIDGKTGEISFTGRLKEEGARRMEKELVQHGAKWWPVKSLKGKFNGIGHSSQWRLVVDPLARSGFVMPDEGVPFSVILTITGPEQNTRVFNEMRQQLQTSGATVADVRTALRQRIR